MPEKDNFVVNESLVNLPAEMTVYEIAELRRRGQISARSAAEFLISLSKTIDMANNCATVTRRELGKNTSSSIN